MQFKQWIKFIGTALLATTFAASSQAAIWSSSEVHYSSGDYLNFANDKHDVTASILTFQHASGHKYGKNFFFIDHSRSDTESGFYGEWYSTFSLGAITGSDMSFGMVKDVGYSPTTKRHLTVLVWSEFLCMVFAGLLKPFQISKK